jgi:DNA-directed RNA polymerase specialized sigma subunit
MKAILKKQKQKQLINHLVLKEFVLEFPDWRSLLPYLTDRQQLIVSLRLGLQKFNGTWVKRISGKVEIVSFSDIAKHLNISHPAVCYSYTQGLENLRQVKKNKGIITRRVNLQLQAMQKSKSA